MSDVMSHSPGVARRDKSLPARLVGVIFSPRDTLAGVVDRPRWFGALAVTTLLVAGAMAAFLTTETGRTALLDAIVLRTERAGGSVSDEAYARLQSMLPMLAVVQPVAVLIIAPLVTTAVAGLLFAIYGVMLGAGGSFRQSLAVAAHAGAINVVRQLFTVPLDFAQGTMGGRTNLGVFFPDLAEGSFLAALLGTIDLFIVWWMVVVAIGTGVLFRRRTSRVFVLMALVYGAIALGIATFVAGRAGQP
jgi:hypothetical protein